MAQCTVYTVYAVYAVYAMYTDIFHLKSIN